MILKSIKGLHWRESETLSTSICHEYPARAAAAVEDQADLVFQAKLAEQAERYGEMVKSVKKVAGINVELTVEE